MTIAVYLEFLALDFVQPPLEALVWQEDGPPFTPPPTFDRAPPPGYAAGLLRGYIDGRGVTFDKVLAVLRLSACQRQRDTG